MEGDPITRALLAAAMLLCTGLACASLYGFIDSVLDIGRALSNGGDRMQAVRAIPKILICFGLMVGFIAFAGVLLRAYS